MLGMNQIKTAALLGLLSGLIVLVSYYLIGNEQGLYLGLVFAALSSFGSWYYSDKAALAAYQAQPIERAQAPELFDMVARLSDRAEIPTPTIFLVPPSHPTPLRLDATPTTPLLL
jgi:heat shock protein HtpX